MEIGVMIRTYLENGGITQTFVSKKSGIKISKLNLALNGNRKLTFDEYALICYVLQLNTDYFLKPMKPEPEKA